MNIEFDIKELLCFAFLNENIFFLLIKELIIKWGLNENIFFC